MKVQADKKRREKEYTVGDKVYLKLQPYRQGSIAARTCHKLRHKYYGPYTITARIGNVAYRLDLPTTTKIHDVFHVSQLKDGTKVPPATPTTLPPFSDDGTIQYQPSKVLKRRQVSSKGRSKHQVLIAWAGLPETEATWEDYDAFADTFHLEDKVVLKGGGIVTHPPKGPDITTGSRPRTRAWARREEELSAAATGSHWAAPRQPTN